MNPLTTENRLQEVIDKNDADDGFSVVMSVEIPTMFALEKLIFVETYRDTTLGLQSCEIMISRC